MVTDRNQPGGLQGVSGCQSFVKGCRYHLGAFLLDDVTWARWPSESGGLAEGLTVWRSSAMVLALREEWAVSNLRQCDLGRSGHPECAGSWNQGTVMK